MVNDGDVGWVAVDWFVAFNLDGVVIVLNGVLVLV